MVSRIKGFFASPWLGMVVGTVSVFWEAFWLLGGPIGIELPQDRRQYFTWGFIALAVSAIQAVWTSQKRILELERQLEPKFEIVFLPENDTDSRPYLQTLTSGRIETPGLPMVKIEERRYRVGIRSLSKVIVPSVHLVLTRCEPQAISSISDTA